MEEILNNWLQEKPKDKFDKELHKYTYYDLMEFANHYHTLQLKQTGVMPRFISLVTSFDFNSINEKIYWLGIQREDIISLQHTKNDGFCLYYFKNEA